MEQCRALVEASSFADLLVRLESGGETIAGDGAVFTSGVAVASQEDPGQKVVLLVASSAPSARANGEARWIKEHQTALETLFGTGGISLVTVIFPGDWPPQPHRARAGRTQVRLISAVHHLWADRLRLFNGRGELDHDQRKAFLTRFGARWTPDEERNYTEAALRTVDRDTGDASGAREALLRNRPDLTPNHVTVIYGPGGIGKTFFLRRVMDRMTRAAAGDPCIGIPVFAELPLLLYTDALETWLSHRGLRLRLEQIRALISAGVVVPVLDALDELVRGQAREGSRAFLEQLGETATRGGKILLSSRDYYLNLDPLVREGLSAADPLELSLGYFTKPGRRRYIQIRTGLNEAAAARWASTLEEQAVDALAGISQEDLESLIGHPLFLDAFCRIILEIPEEQRSVAADEFRIASPDVFGDIVGRVLEREEAKVQPGWDAKIANHVLDDWKQPFTPDRQQAVLGALVLLVARDGARETFRRSNTDERYRELYHGLFRFTTGVNAPAAATRKEILGELVGSILGEPQIADHVPDAEKETRKAEALDEYAGFLLQHTLSDTRPDLVDDLLFATRHRAYFDYLLADALLAELQTALREPNGSQREAFIDWCLAHHVFESPEGTEAEPPFAGCLDFVLWHRDALDQAINLILEFFRSDEVDDVLGSYLASLGLAVLLRSGQRSGRAILFDQSFGVSSQAQIHVMENVVPAISNLDVQNCSFGDLTMGESMVRDLNVLECDLHRLKIRGANIARADFDQCTVENLTLAGTIHWSDSMIDLEASAIDIEPTAQVFMDRCEVHPELLKALEDAAHVRPDLLRIEKCKALEPVSISEQFTKGRLFLNKLMSLSRRHGHEEFGVYSMKLRGRSGATADTYPRALQILQDAGVATANDMVFLTKVGEEHRFAGKERPGLRPYEEVAEYWGPIVRQLDEVL